MSDDILARWRLVLGEAAQLGLGSPRLSGRMAGCDAALSWLYDRDPELEARDVMTSSCEGGRPRGATGGDAGESDERRGGPTGSGMMTVPTWIDQIQRLFPRETVERLERDAIERYQIHEIVTNRDVLARVEPSETLLQAVLRTRHLMNPDVLDMARELVRRVVEQLMHRLARDVSVAFNGMRQRRPSSYRVAKNFDAARTVRENLAWYQPEERKLYIREPRFSSRARRHSARWQIVLLVDESGSMLRSVIHAAVTAACLWGLPAIKTHLCIFDTQVVDLTEHVSDPVETLMKVQLGGGTDIGKAVAYGARLIEQPRRSIVVIVSDFFEGAPPQALVSSVKSLCDQGTIVLGLAALDDEANPAFDRDLAARLVEVGAQVGAMTPGQLASWIAEKVRA